MSRTLEERVDEIGANLTYTTRLLEEVMVLLQNTYFGHVGSETEYPDVAEIQASAEEMKQRISKHYEDVCSLWGHEERSERVENQGVDNSAEDG